MRGRRPAWFDRYRVHVPPCDTGRVKVERFTIGEHDFGNFRESLHGRGTPPGEYTRLVVDDVLWMSDTAAEIADHLGVIERIERWGAERVLIHGLGLGMVLRAALWAPDVRHVDVVEIDGDVIEAVGPHYWMLADALGVDLTIWHDNAFTRRWPVRSWWDVVWHDVWPNICEDNLPEMAHLHRRFGSRCDWQDSWSRRESLRQRRADRHSAWR